MRRFQVGDIHITLLDDGPFKLDGGGMFGVVPQALWAKHLPPDGSNRVHLSLVCPLVESAGRRVLVDTGAGRSLPPKLQDIFALDPDHTLLDSLATAGHVPADIDVVVNTHLHFDHSGWNTRPAPEGGRCATFPRATYVVAAREWDAAVRPDVRSAPAYPQENFAPLEDMARALERVEGEVELARGVHALPAPGHTCGHQVVRIASGGQVAVFLGDLVPTPAHLPLAWHMAYDLDPLLLLETKRAFLERALRERWLLIFDHDPQQRVGHVEGDRVESLTFRPLAISR